MKYQGKITDPKDLVTKEYVDNSIPSVPSASTSNPAMDGTASPGSSTAYARGDHVHPISVVANPTLAGTEDALASIEIGGVKFKSPLQIEFVHYGSSTLADVAAIINRGNIPVCLNNTVASGYLECGWFRRMYSGGYYFVADKDNITGSITTWFLRSSGVWSSYSYSLFTSTVQDSAISSPAGSAIIAYVKNLNLGQGFATCDTAESTTAKAATLANYVLADGGVVAVKFTYAVPASATLNVNGKGAKNIYYRGSAITAGMISAGDTAVFMYDGTQYDLLCIDKTYASLDSPAFTGTPTAPTAAPGTNTTQIATTAFVATAIDNAITAAIGGSY